MKRFLLSFVLAVSLFLSGAAAQFSHESVKLPCTFGVAANPEDATNKARLEKIVAYLVANGFKGAININRDNKLTPIPGCVEPPVFSYLVFTWPREGANLPGNNEPFSAAYDLALKSPSVLLTELENHFRFGNPFATPQFKEDSALVPTPPGPSQPANPIGPALDDSPGKFYPAVGDMSPAGVLFVQDGKTFKKVCKKTPFGGSCFWEKQ